MSEFQKDLIQDFKRFLKEELFYDLETVRYSKIPPSNDPFNRTRKEINPVFLVEENNREPIVVKCFLDPKLAPHQVDKTIEST